MRISDWSSDVCSSDLWLKVKNKITREARIVDMIIEDARAKTLICKMLDDGRTVWRHQRVWSGPGRFEIRDRGVYRGKICLLRRDGLSLNRADDVLRVEFIQSLWSQCAVAPRACKNSGQIEPSPAREGRGCCGQKNACRPVLAQPRAERNSDA